MLLPQSQLPQLMCSPGGSVGALLAMYTVRHKTKHNKFRIGVPVILAVQIIVVCVVYIALR